jgi:type I restriction enzyme R subunit
MDFAKTFFAKHSLLNILTKYCVFDVDRKLLVMRPYQIVAAERILQRINHRHQSPAAGQRGSGRLHLAHHRQRQDLTSFKAARLARALPDIDKVLFVVDRKDLDYQTMREYERFEKGAANSNTSTRCCSGNWKTPTPASSLPPSRSSPASSPRTRSTRSMTRMWW